MAITTAIIFVVAFAGCALSLRKRRRKPEVLYIHDLAAWKKNVETNWGD